MAAGYEARARVTADMSGFVSAASQGASAANMMANAVRALNTQLQGTQQAATQQGAQIRNLSQTTQQGAQSTRQHTSAAQAAAQAARDAANAYNAATTGVHNYQTSTAQSTQATRQNQQQQDRATSSLRAMGRELVRLEDQRKTLLQIQQRNGRLNNQETAALRTINERLGQVRSSVSQLNDTQRAQVQLSSDLARAQQATSSGMASMARYAREQNQATAQGVQVQRESVSSLRSLAQEQVRLSDQRRSFMEYQAAGNQLTREQAAALGVTQDRLRELGRATAQLSSQQRAQVSNERELVRARQASSQVTREVAQQSRDLARSQRDQISSTQQTVRAAGDFNSSLWSMRSAVQDVGGSMQQLWSVSSRVTQSLWENFSAQEMTIAQIARVSQESSTMMDSIVSSVREMSTEIPIAFDELGRIAMLGSQVGVASESLEGFTETVALFAATSEVSADETATLMARIMEMTNLNNTHGQDSVQNLGSAVAYLGSNMVATDKEILTTIESIATMTTQAGMSAETTIGLGAAMASLRIRPEIARGATQRVFLQLGEAVDGTSQEMQTLTEMTGKSQDELQNLRDSDYDQFFLTIMEALHGAYNAGEDLIPTLREIGINNSRDAEVVARLAANYGVLKNGVEGAHTSFESGNYLYEESAKIFETLTARLELLRNTWQNFLFTAVEAIGPFLIGVMDAATAVIEFADSMDMAPLVGWGAVALGLVGTIGLLSSGFANLGVGVLAIRGLFNMLTGVTTATGAAMTAQAGTTAAATASQTAYQGALMRTVSWGSATVTSVLATSSAMGVMGGAARRAATSLGAVALANPVLLIGGITAALVAASVEWGAFGDQADRARQSVLDANEAHITAAGGIDGLRNALEADTEAWKNAQEHANAYIDELDDSTRSFSTAAEEITSNSRFRMVASQDMAEADREAAEEAQALSDRQQSLRDELDISSEGFSESSASADKLAKSSHDLAIEQGLVEDATKTVNRATAETEEAMTDSAYAVGLASRQWAALSLESAVTESGLLKNAEAFDIVRASGVDLGAALTKEMGEAGAGAEYLRAKAEEVRGEFSSWENFLEGLNEFTDNMVWDGWRPFTTNAIEAADSLDEFAENLESTTYSLEEAARGVDILEGAFVELPDGTKATTEELALMGEEGAEAAAVANLLETEVDSLGTSIDVLRDGLGTFIDPLQTWKDTLEDAEVEVEGLGASLSQVEGGFSTYMDNLEESQQAQMEWGQNLLTLARDVPPEVVAGLAEMGVEGAGLVQDLVNASDEEVDRFVEIWEAGSGDALDQFAVMFSDFITMSQNTGDVAGLDFIYNLMDQVASGDISFREAVDAMTDYAETEFEESDPTAEAQLESTKAMIELTKTIRQMRKDAQGATPTVKPQVNTQSAWQKFKSFVSRVLNTKISPTIIPRLTTPTGFRDGGWIGGPGGPRQDLVPLMASPGEFIVNARAAGMFARELEWMNAQGNGGSSAGDQVPNFVPDNIMDLPQTSPSSVQMMMPEGLEAAMRTNSVASGPRMVINVYNTYPQAEPTSTTINRSLVYAAALDGVS